MHAVIAGAALIATSVAALAQTLPGTKRDLAFDAHMKTVDLDDPQLRFEYKKPTADGSSLGLYIGVGTAPTDRSFAPTNASSIPEAEVVSYRLARFLGVARNYCPVDYYKLGPKAMATFRGMVQNTKETWPARIDNRNLLLKEMKKSPDTLLGIYRLKSKTKMFTVTTLGDEGKFNTSTGLAQEIKASGRMPDERRIPLEGVKGGQPGFPVTPTERRVELARQLSTIFVVDQLLGQWDRFWNNLEAAGDRNGRLKLIARDNGGASLDDWVDYENYTSWVTRFDRDLIERLTALNRFLKGEASSFAGYTSAAAWKEAAGFIVPASYETFVKKLGLLVDKRVPELVKRYGDRTYFPPKSPEVAALDAADTGEED